ncbi:MAG TPA: hemerythrin domain-containing protein [Thermoanaerobaculia bacterium]|nr:hemerythrin domain-containing protein [Thermoanaerobaculia bacterium]
MQNDPLKLLLAEHEIIEGAKDVIAAMDQLWTRDAGAYERAAGELLSFFVSYSDGYHHQKEEVVLFPALRSHPDFYSHDVIDELEEHHQTFRDHVAQMKRALGAKDYAEAHARLTRYLDELLDHIAVENDELFVMAESLLGEAELERVFFRFKDVDRELGDDRKKELERRLAAIKAGL